MFRRQTQLSKYTLKLQRHPLHIPSPEFRATSPCWRCFWGCDLQENSLARAGLRADQHRQQKNNGQPEDTLQTREDATSIDRHRTDSSRRRQQVFQDRQRQVLEPVPQSELDLPV